MKAGRCESWILGLRQMGHVASVEILTDWHSISYTTDLVVMQWSRCRKQKLIQTSEDIFVCTTNQNCGPLNVLTLSRVVHSSRQRIKINPL